METLGVAEAVRSNPGTLKALFVGGQKQVQLEELLELFNVSFSAPGSNRRQLENTAFIFWKDWLLEVDGNVIYLNCQNLLKLSAF